MKHLKFLSIVIIFVLAGCVSSGEHKAKLNEIEAQKNTIASLQEQIKAKDEENSSLKNQVDSKDTQIALLSDEKAKIAEEKKKAIEEKEKALSELKGTYNSMMTELQGEIKKGEIAVTQLKDKLSLSMVDRILFDSGSADVKKDGKKVLDRVADILKKVTDKQIRIEGHTDNVPVGPKVAKKFASNWELSVARAINVVKYLQGQGVDPNLTSATGYGEFKPIASNDTDEGKAKNRRIEIVLTPLDTDIPAEK